MVPWQCFNMLLENSQNSFQFYYQYFKLIEHFKLIESSPYQTNPVKSSEYLVLQTLLSLINPIVKLLCQLSSITIVYSNIGFNSSSLTLLVPMTSKCRPLSHHIFFCRFKSSTFLKKLIILEVCLVCLMYFPLFSIHIADLISNIMRGACSGTTCILVYQFIVYHSEVW